jgi:hypothetical protein
MFLIDGILKRKEIDKIVTNSVLQGSSPPISLKKALGFPRASTAFSEEAYWFFFMLFITARICASEGLRPI